MKNLNQTISSLLKEETTTDNLEQIGSFLSEYNVTDIKNLNALLLEINRNIRIIQESPETGPDTEDALNQLDQQLIDVISNFNEMLSASRTLSKLVTKTLTQFDKLS